MADCALALAGIVRLGRSPPKARGGPGVRRSLVVGRSHHRPMSCCSVGFKPARFASFPTSYTDNRYGVCCPGVGLVTNGTTAMWESAITANCQGGIGVAAGEQAHGGFSKDVRCTLAGGSRSAQQLRRGPADGAVLVAWMGQEQAGWKTCEIRLRGSSVGNLVGRSRAVPPRPLA